MSLASQHQRLLDDSAIAPQVQRDRQYRTIETKAELRSLGFTASQARVPALLIPQHDAWGEIKTYLLRPDLPRIVKGRPSKYETPKGSSMVMDVPPSVRTSLGDPTIPLYVTEGSRKADAAASIGLACISFTGVWSWRGRNDRGGTTALPDLEAVALKQRETYVVYDSDVMLKPEVHAALARLSDLLKGRGARVRFVYLPPSSNGQKTGLDDFLAAGNGVAELHERASTKLKEFESTGAPPETPYEASSRGILWRKTSDQGSTPVRLCNFTAIITSDIARDDGVEVEEELELEGELLGRPFKISIATREFGSMGWVLGSVGAGAIVEPGQGVRERLRHAIQTLSGDIPRRVRYGHLGWRQIDGEHCYLHASGAIGPDGLISGLEVAVSEPLAPFVLALPTTDQALVEAIQASLGLAWLTSDGTGFVLLAAVGRAALGQCDTTLWLYGETGSFKSELAALCQQHWGAGFDARHLPASFTATPNYIEGLLFVAKDSLTVVDDFAPEGGTYDQARAHQSAARIIRAQGNQQARGRMQADSRLRPAKPPRGLLLATGEDLPRGHSVRARTLIVSIDRSTVDLERLTELQADARAGRLATSLAGYIQSLAPDFPKRAAAAKERTEQLRHQAPTDGMHQRTPDSIAQLKVGLETYLQYALEAGALSDREHALLTKQGFAALDRVGRTQAAYQTSTEPATRYLELLRSAVGSGAAHIASLSGDKPDTPWAWGWRRSDLPGETHWREQGTRIGWVNGADLWLDPDASFGVAQKVAQGVGDPFTVSRTTLNKRLAERGLLSSTDLETRECVAIRRSIAGTRRQVLHLPSSHIVDQYPEGEPDSGAGRDGRTTEGEGFSE